jgi:hypothetical protein
MTDLRYVQLRAPTRKQQARFDEADLRDANARKQTLDIDDKPAANAVHNHFQGPQSARGSLSSEPLTAAFITYHGHRNTKLSWWNRLRRWL